MKRNPIILIISITLFLLVFSSYAQLAMNLKLNGQSYIKHEKIYARLTVKNQSGQTIVFGSNEKLKGEISLKIETIKGETPKIVQAPVYEINDIILHAGERHTFDIPITRYYEFPNDGKYRLKAVVTYSQLPKAYETSQVEFSIVSGNTVWSTLVGVPMDDDQQIDQRRYSIISYFDGSSKIFCLLVDDEKRIYGLTKVGFDIGTVKPQCEIGRLSNLHLLIQNSATIFSYFVYDINCKLEDKEVYKKADEHTIPQLVKDEKTGRIHVVGGILAVEGEDYFEKKESSTQKNNEK